MESRAHASAPPSWPERRPVELVDAREDGAPGGSVSRLLERMRHGAFQGRQLGQAFATWTRMIDRGHLIALGLAGSLASAGLWPLLTWLVRRGYVDVVVSTSANATEDLLEHRGARFYQVEPERVDDVELRRRGYYRFYDHVVSAADYDAMEDFTARVLRAPGRHVAGAHAAGTRLHARARPLARRPGPRRDRWPRRAFATACPSSSPPRPTARCPRAIAPAAPRGPSWTSSPTTTSLIEIMHGFMPPGPGTAAIFLGGGVPKDFIQIAATSVSTLRGTGEPSPHVAAIQITTDNAVYGGLGGASVASECLSWGKESADGDNVMVFADVTIALPAPLPGAARALRSATTCGRRARPSRRRCARSSSDTPCYDAAMKIAFGIGFGGSPPLLLGDDAATFMDLVRMAEGYGAAAIGTYDSAFLGGDAFVRATLMATASSARRHRPPPEQSPDARAPDHGIVPRLPRRPHAAGAPSSTWPAATAPCSTSGIPRRRGPGSRTT